MIFVLWFVSLNKQRPKDILLRRDRRVVMPKVKLPSTKPATKSRLPKKAGLTGARGSPPATDTLGDGNYTDLLNDTSEMLHRDDDMVSFKFTGLQTLVGRTMYFSVSVFLATSRFIKSERATFN